MNLLSSGKKRKRIRIVIPAYPAFNIYSNVANKTTALGPVCVATSVRELGDWDVEVIDENNFSLHGPRTEQGEVNHSLLQRMRSADVVGFYGGLTSTVPRLYELARFYKKEGVITVAGGQHFVEETMPEAFASGIDYIVRGEGEITIRELLRSLENGSDLRSVKGLAYGEGGKIIQTPPREPITDFDILPLPDFSLVRYARISIYPVERIRGCGMDCEFCTVKGKPRFASPERLLEQISSLVETRDARHFFIVDDLFGQQREETIRFCRMLFEYQRRINLRLDFTVQIRLDKAKDGELLSAMRKAGINTVAIGFESPIEEELQIMRKHIVPEEMIKLARVFQRFGFLVHGMFIFGYPLAEGVFSMPVAERVRRFRIFIRQARIDTVQVLLPVPLPGTELRQRLLAQNRIYPSGDVGWEYYDGNFPVFEPDQPVAAEDLQMAVQQIMGKFYRFRYFFLVVINVFAFPCLLFYLHRLKDGWKKWYRNWRNALVRFGGWLLMKGWRKQYQQGDFVYKLERARGRLKGRQQ